MSDICSTIPLSCLDPSRIFAGVYNPNCAGFGNPANFQAEQAIFNSGFEQLIHNFGVSIGYCVNNFSMEDMNNIYGEHTTMYWLDPIPIKAYIQLDEQSPIYTIGGLDSSDTITAYIHINTFTTTFSSLSIFNEYLMTENDDPIITEDGQPIYLDINFNDDAVYEYLLTEDSDPLLTEDGQYLYVREFDRSYIDRLQENKNPIEPKSGDKIIVYPLGCNRPNDRGVKIFEVTEVLDQDVSELNPIMGHYVWRIKGVRSESNSVTNEPRERQNNQISDSSFFGKLSSSMFPELTGNKKKYTPNSDDYVRTKVFPPSTSGNNGSIYGQYY